MRPSPRFLILVFVVALGLLGGRAASADIAGGKEAFKLKRGSEALAQFQPLAEAGDREAVYWMGRLYDSGIGVAQDKQQALTWFTKAAEAGHVESQRVIGIYHAEGLGGLARDDKQAFDWYSRAAGAGNAKAMRNLAGLYVEGRGTPRDYAMAAQWYQKAADAGHVKARRGLAYLYYFGRGVPQDRTRAAQLFRAAADDGDEQASVNLGFVHYHGKGVPQDFGKAREAFEKAANRGNAEAQLFMARMHLRGEGGAKDPRQAFFWALLARIQKPDHAAWYFERLRGQLSRADKAALRKRVASWIPKD